MQEMFLFWTLFLWSNHLAASQGQTNITAEPGHDVVLPCRAGHDGGIVAVNLTRPDLGPKDVLFYRNGKPNKDQHPSYQNRVDLQDEQIKDGHMNLTLKNLTTDDTGTYVCRVFQRKTGESQSAESISTIHLEVSPPPDCPDTPEGSKRRKRSAGSNCPKNPSGTTQDGRNQDGGGKDGGDKDGGDKDGGDKDGGHKAGGDKDGGDKVGGDKVGGHLGLIGGLLAVVIVVMVVGVWFYKRHQKKKNPPRPPDQSLLQPGVNDDKNINV